MKTLQVRYFQDADDHFIAVTDETPRGPLKGFVFVGKRLLGEEICQEAFAIDQIAKWRKLDITDVPSRCVEAFGYERSPAQPNLRRSPSQSKTRGPIRKSV